MLDTYDTPLVVPFPNMRGTMLNEKPEQDVQWMSPAATSSPTPQHTREFPSGLISDYIKMVDQLIAAEPQINIWV